MDTADRIAVIKKIETVTPAVKAFTLADARGNRLPAFSPGSHVALAFGDGERRWTNSYSLVGSPNGSTYRIAVRRCGEAAAKGGSAYLHDRAAVGMTLVMSGPRNFFPPARAAGRHVLIAGGIGITPFLSYLPAFRGSSASFELHYAIRDRASGAFCEHLCEEYADDVHYYIGAEGGRLVPVAIMKGRPHGTHIYACGPQSLLRAVNQAAAELGYPEGHVHFEEFVPPRPAEAAPFLASVPALGLRVTVEAGQSLLEVLERAGAPISSSCRVGQCGTCEIGVLAGEPDHYDKCLTAAERAAGRMIACVSRCRGSSLEIALSGR